MKCAIAALIGLTITLLASNCSAQLTATGRHQTGVLLGYILSQKGWGGGGGIGYGGHTPCCETKSWHWGHWPQGWGWQWGIAPHCQPNPFEVLLRKLFAKEFDLFKKEEAIALGQAKAEVKTAKVAAVAEVKGAKAGAAAPAAAHRR